MAVVRTLLPSERAIGDRVAALRRTHRLSQEDLAKAVGLSRDQLANIEVGRSHLRFWVGWEICRALNTDQLYLATGEPPLSPFRDLLISDGLSPFEKDGLFSEICIRQFGAALRIARSAGEVGPGMPDYENRLMDLVRGYAGVVPEGERPRLVAHLVKAFDAFWDQLTHPDVENSLTHVNELGNNPPVKSQMEALLTRLNEATKQRGKKSELAEYLGVPLPRISQWLSGEREPGGETTLNLLTWVEQQEAKQKSPGGAGNTTQGKATQFKESRSHESQKSDRGRS